MLDKTSYCREIEVDPSSGRSSRHAADHLPISLRRLHRTHLDRTRSWANEPELMRLMDRSGFVSEAEHVAWFEELTHRNDRRYFAIELGDDHRHVGNVWLWQIDARHRKAEVRIVIGDSTARSRGLGTTAIELVCREAFDSLGLTRVYAYTLAINPRARRAFEKAGFELEGVLRNDRRTPDGFCDAFLLAKLHSPKAEAE
jgi:RimJ/RimL family protein N-acetyltransferase